MAKTSLLTVAAKHSIRLHGKALFKAAAAPAFQTQPLHETTGEAVRHAQLLPDMQTHLKFQKLTFQGKKATILL